MSAHRALHVCQFSTLDDLPKRKHGDSGAVLTFIRQHHVCRASTWEMTQALYDSLLTLHRRGALTLTKGAYPWITWRLSR